MLDLLIEDATVLTTDPARPRAQPVGVWNGRIVGVDEERASLAARRSVHRVQLRPARGERAPRRAVRFIGRLVGAGEELTVAEALSAATIGAARA